MTMTAENACISCARKKRKCDRNFPVCSACRRLHHVCQYPRPSTKVSAGTGSSAPNYPIKAPGSKLGGPANAIQPDQFWSHFAMAATSTATTACNTCRKGKRQCDRALSGCARCTRLRIHCIYEGKQTFTSNLGIYRQSTPVRSIEAKVAFPVPTKQHMPMLLHSFMQTFGMEPLPVDTGSLAFLLRSDWIQLALSDACFFHATLFAASAHLDAFRGIGSNQMTLYHHTMALRFLNDRIAHPGGTIDEGAIACIAPLVFFSSMGSDESSSRIHRQGLMQMVRAKGGLHQLGFANFLSALIPVCTLTEAIIFDSKLDIPFLDIPECLPTPPTYLISAALSRSSRVTGYWDLSAEAIQIFEEIHYASKCLAKQIKTGRQQPRFQEMRVRWHSWLQKTETPHMVSDGVSNATCDDGISESCHVAALIFWFLVDDSMPASVTTLQNLVEKLKAALRATAMDKWVKCAPEAHTWICLVGAGAASKGDDRAWFSLRHGQPVICIRSEGPELYLQCWAVYDWVRARRKLRISQAAKQ